MQEAVSICAGVSCLRHLSPLLPPHLSGRVWPHCSSEMALPSHRDCPCQGQWPLASVTQAARASPLFLPPHSYLPTLSRRPCFYLALAAQASLSRPCALQPSPALGLDVLQCTSSAHTFLSHPHPTVQQGLFPSFPLEPTLSPTGSLSSVLGADPLLGSPPSWGHCTHPSGAHPFR